MRERARVRRILKMLKEIWESNPDIRLGQLFQNALAGAPELYWIEDDELERHLREFYYHEGHK